MNGHPGLNALYTHPLPKPGSASLQPHTNPPSPSHTNPPSSSHPPSPEVPVPPRATAEVLAKQSQLWLRGEREREEWRRAHKVVEWDGWEEGLVGNVLGDLEVLRSARGGGDSPFTDGGIVHF